jgi:SulP family sulfate permease
VITASVVLVSLLFLTPLFYYLPRVVLAAIIVVAVAGLIDVGAAVKLFRVKTSDGLVLLAAFLCTLAAGVEWGIFCGVAVSLLLFIRRSAYPRITELGYCEEEDTFRSIEFYPQAKTYPGTLVMRADTSLYFANMKFLEDWLRARLSERADVRRVVMDFSGVNDIDAVAVNDLEELAAALKETGVECVFAGMKHQVRDTLSRAGWQERHPAQTGFSTLKHALRDLAPLT